MPQDVVFRPDVLYNMLITGVISFVVGILVGWFGHIFSLRRERQNRIWQELQYWRHRITEIEKMILDTDPRSTGAIQLARMDSDQEIIWPNERSKLLIQEAKEARQKIENLKSKLGIE